MRANPWGLSSIYGNVGEWCADIWYDSYEGAPVDGAVRSGNDSDRVWRGGSWDQPPEELRSYYRGADGATDTEKTLGFRLVLPTNVKATYRGPWTTPARAGATAGTPAVVLSDQRGNRRGHLRGGHGDVLADAERRRPGPHHRNPRALGRRDLPPVIGPVAGGGPATVIDRDDQRRPALVVRHRLGHLPQPADEPVGRYAASRYRS